ncbi:MAG: DUF4190 domain-containing protein [Acidimicrobiales bacterium]
MTDHTAPDSPTYGPVPPPGQPDGTTLRPGRRAYAGPERPVQPGDYHVPTHPHYEPPAATNGLAIASMVLGILGLLFLYYIGPALALVFGYRSRRQIDRSQGTQSGRGMAKAGIIMGWVGVGLAIVFTGLFIVSAVAVDDELDRLEDDLGANIPAAEPAEPVPATDAELDDLFDSEPLPAPDDITLDVVVLSEQCFGSAGCNVSFELDMMLLSEVPDANYRVIYEVSGDESGPITGTIDVTGDQYVVFEEFASTASADTELTATVTGVRP